MTIFHVTFLQQLKWYNSLLFLHSVLTILSWGLQTQGTSHVVCSFKTLVSEWAGDSYTTSCLKMAESDTKVNHDSQKWQGRNAKTGRQLEGGGNFWGLHREGFIWVEPERVCVFWGLKHFKACRQEEGVKESKMAKNRPSLQLSYRENKQILVSYLWQATTE